MLQQRLALSDAGRVRSPFTIAASLAAITAGVLAIPSDLSDLAHAAPAVAAAAAAAACGRAASERVNGRARRGWALMALAASGWTLDAAALGTSSHIRLLSGIAAAVAVFLLTGRSVGLATKVRVLVDGLVAGMSLVLLAWGPLLGPRYDSAHGVTRLLALSAPVTDMVVLALLLAAGVRVSRGSRRPWALLVLGFVLLGTGNGVMAWLQFDGFMQTRMANTICWTTGAVLVLLAARSPMINASPLAQDPTPTRPFALLLPYAPLLVGSAVTASEWVQGTINSGLVAVGTALLVLLFLRQLLAQFEAMRVARDLDALVDDKTARLHRQELQLRSLVQHTSDVLTIVDPDRVIRYMSPSGTAVFGCAPTQLISLGVTEHVHPEDVEELLAAIRSAPVGEAAPMCITVRFRHADDRWVTTETTVADLRSDPGIGGFLLTIRDVTERLALEEQRRHDALHDPLTGLGNRVLFNDRLAHAAARAARNPEAIAVLLLDLDGFKDVNDTLGDACGDQLLREVGDRLRRTLRPGDTIARIGGDEFAVLLERSEADVAETVAGRILAGLRAPADIDGRNIVPLGSIGVASGSTNRSTADSLLRGAGLALQQAKQRGKGCYAVFQDGMEQAALLRVELENDLRRAIRSGELELHYQPIVEIPTGRISGVEALVRWRHPTKGLIPPGEFIPVAEDSDLVVELGRWVLWTAASQLRDWQELMPGQAGLTMSLNVATRQLTSAWLVQEVERVLTATGIDPASLILEITEGALLHAAGPMEERLEELRALGVRLAIDDFGTGWSSLSRLRAFPVDKLKIDRSFVNEIASADDDAPLIAAIVAMAHSLGLTLVAEGVETVEQLACLHMLGCEEVQGFLLSRPVVHDVIASLLAAPHGLLSDLDDDDADHDERPRRSSDDREFMALLASAAVGADDAKIMDAALSELQRVSAVDTIYLTRVEPDTAFQQVEASTADAHGFLPTGTVIPWAASPCARMLAGGPRTATLSSEFPAHPLSAHRPKTHVSVPVVDEHGNVWGTLCGASTATAGMRASLVVLFEVFASVIAQHLFGATDAPREAALAERLSGAPAIVSR